MKFIGSKFLIELDFPSSKFLGENRDFMLDVYRKHKVESSNDVILIHTPINYYFGERIKRSVESSFHLPPTDTDVAINLYVQNSQNSSPIFHNHIHTPSTICGVFYLDIPKEGGEFEILLSPQEDGSGIIKFKPKEDKLYLFPPWLFHRPLPQKDEKPRFCLNFQYITDSRPILKKFGYTW